MQNAKYIFFSVPSVAPENVTALNTTSTSIFLAWHAVPSNQRSGNMGYKVNFTLQSKLYERRYTEEVSVTVAYVNLTGLRKSRNFSITVSAFNECGDGPRSVNLFVRTDEDSKCFISKVQNIICRVLDNNPNYSRTLIGSHLWSVRGQSHRWRHHYKVFPSVY